MIYLRKPKRAVKPGEVFNPSIHIDRRLGLSDRRTGKKKRKGWNFLDERRIGQKERRKS